MNVLTKMAVKTRRFSVVFKIALIAVLLLILLIPLAMIQGLVVERESRRADAEREILSGWGGRQIVAGPVLTVPYIEFELDSRGRRVEKVAYARFLPDTLAFDAAAEPQTRFRGIYDVTVYTAKIRASGSFRRPSFGGWKIASEDILWNDAFLSVELPDMRAIRSRVSLLWGSRASPFETASPTLGMFGGSDGYDSWSEAAPSGATPGEIRAPVPALAQAGAGEILPFSFECELQGGDSLSFLPLGGETTVSVTSPWKSPSFQGAYFPTTRSLGDKGFESTWKILSTTRVYPQRWQAGEISASTLAGSAFGVRLMAVVDSYQKVTRAAKYGILFILLPFLTLFLFEVFSGRKVHPLQYLFVGFAECIFYLLLLSLSEHVSFAVSYIAASAASTGLISLYTFAAMRGWRKSLLILPILATAYTFLYMVLRSEDYALLVGSLGLFLILAAVMILTRKIDWYGLRPKTRPEDGGQ